MSDKKKTRPARLDADGTARPLTQIYKYVLLPSGEHTGYGITYINPQVKK